MSTNGMVSSDIPNTAPPSEKMAMKSGISSTSSVGDRSAAETTRRNAASTAPVSVSTANAPPTSSTNAMMGAASSSTNPRMGAWSTIAAEWSRRLTTLSSPRSMRS